MNSIRTPWGSSQDSRQYDEGITFHSTASHGGFHLSRKRQAMLKRVFPDFTTFAGGPWYEEDQDWAIVVLAFPEVFPTDTLRQAIIIARSSARPCPYSGRTYPQWEAIVTWLNSPIGKPLVAKAKEYEATIADMWEPGSMGAPVTGYPRGCWSVHFTRVRDKATQTVVLSGYPTEKHYTDQRLAELTAKPETAEV